ncbi:nucleotidyl transferase AbiEii/AbiGii toxin family protein [Haloechinothrix halophila]|uniref:nucleotidyl transferase AbiEii/AbiGii toxin family protein n=1 Tax=Haloechinothrix halophila TaxID=1069073 RepID=UPI0003F678B9|nr:nucleotidyl transferase AbiEii/AbiGii toxin family protein [Haloechinothrix halophila]
MLDPKELASTASAFGVAEEQVRRDHLISHILAALASLDVPVVFFGGTALARTWLTGPANGGRLSEDIDLYTDQRQEIAQLLTRQLPVMLRREFPGSSWQPSLDRVRSSEAARLLSRDGIEVRIQLLSTSHHRELAAWPTDRTTVSLRYSDVDNVTLCVPTLTAFAAMKTAAWMDRTTARDLYDLAALAPLGTLNEETASLVRRITGWTVGPYLFRSLPKFDWNAQLGHQTRDLPPAADCLMRVRASYADALGWNHD